MPLLETIGSGGARGYGLFGKISFNGLTSETAAESAKQIKLDFPSSPSGVYWIRGSDGVAYQVYCDMTLDGGGWMMILNYVHQSGTNPSLLVRTSSFPLLNNQYTFADESGSTSVGGSWGHISNSLANSITWSEYMFYGKSSGHSRVIHFRGNNSNIVSYIKTGSGSMSPSHRDELTNFSGSLRSNSTLPLHMTTSEGFSNEGDKAMTEFPMYGDSSIGNPRSHWGIKGQTNRWEVDDAGTNVSTIHRVWAR